MMIETDWIKQVIRDFWKTILSANIKPSDPCHLNMSAKSFFITLVYDCFLKLNWTSFVHQFQLNFLPHLDIVSQNEVDWFSALALVNWQFQEQFWRSRWWAFWENVVSLLPGIHSAWQSFYTNIFVQSVIFCDFFGQSWLDVLNFKLIYFGYFTFSSGLVFSAKLYQVAEIVVKHLR